MILCPYLGDDTLGVAIFYAAFKGDSNTLFTFLLTYGFSPVLYAEPSTSVEVGTKFKTPCNFTLRYRH
jgi:hypothetical protein